MSVISQDSGSAGIAAVSLTGEAQSVPNGCMSGNQAVPAPARWAADQTHFAGKGSQHAATLHDARWDLRILRKPMEPTGEM
jgi:hypothetical protein